MSISKDVKYIRNPAEEGAAAARQENREAIENANLDEGVRISFKPKYKKLYFYYRKHGYSGRAAHETVLRFAQKERDYKKHKGRIKDY